MMTRFKRKTRRSESNATQAAAATKKQPVAFTHNTSDVDADIAAAVAAVAAPATQTAITAVGTTDEETAAAAALLLVQSVDEKNHRIFPDHAYVVAYQDALLVCEHACHTQYGTGACPAVCTDHGTQPDFLQRPLPREPQPPRILSKALSRTAARFATPQLESMCTVSQPAFATSTVCVPAALPTKVSTTSTTGAPAKRKRPQYIRAGALGDAPVQGKQGKQSNTIISMPWNTINALPLRKNRATFKHTTFQKPSNKR
jgi:hypothetical protein